MLANFATTTGAFETGRVAANGLSELCPTSPGSDVLDGLSQPQKTIPTRWLYDMRGSLLFEAITKLPEYYPTRTETSLLRAHAAEIAQLVGQAPMLVEFGSGSSLKTQELLYRMPCTTYVPIDICGEILEEAAQLLGPSFPQATINPIQGDFTKALRLPPRAADKRVLGFFPGSTIGNFGPDQAVDLLQTMRHTLGENSLLLIGIDRLKAIDRLIAAYDDADGVTALFNLNVLDHVNRELGGSIPVSDFVHQARWNEEAGRIEMHLEASRNLKFDVAGKLFTMERGETIHTENSHKFRPQEMSWLLAAGGWRTVRHWTDMDCDFSLILAKAV